MERDSAPLTALHEESRSLSDVLRQTDPQQKKSFCVSMCGCWLLRGRAGGR